MGGIKDLETLLTFCEFDHSVFAFRQPPIRRVIRLPATRLFTHLNDVTLSRTIIYALEAASTALPSVVPPSRRPGLRSAGSARPEALR